ncbi:hypothetical protein C7444_11451 [Sphaerotilus hippei]|uniref:Uncharacterized protein n=1 Tax=Sphaerotilus hippei TaxID=744406 RepID=A0A318GXP7_9BURK|nr:hypothetical protein [Sphaerotilus hippei]PXW94352.1 hypothetical protein C7444_11451 [Sphaerotilus hippei]
MIHIVELPADLPPRAWFAFDGEDLRRKVATMLDCEPWSIWDVTSAREMLEMVDAEPGQAGARERFPALCALGEANGWDTPLYRADALLGDGMLQAGDVDLIQACAAALGQRGALKLYPDDSAAMAAFERGDVEFDTHGWKARWALRQQLVELEVLADDH